MRRVILTVLGTVAGLVALLSFKSHSATPAATPVSAPAASTSGGGSGGSGSDSPIGSGSFSGSSSAASKTVTGSAASTIYGPVQVQIVVQDGKVTAARAVVYPEETSMDEQINQFAIPTLSREAVSDDSAKIDMVSGATYTSQGYLSSLQSALDRAGLK
jgi:uncharacterized protein with FMN-binding domain